jgi:hypothetical protein
VPKWSYVTKYINPKETMDNIHSHKGACSSSACFFGKWSKQIIYSIAYKDLEENLHSLIELNTCSCGLKVESKRLMAIVETPHHRNHTTLEHDPNPQFRGLVGRRHGLPGQDTKRITDFDAKWDQIVKQLAKKEKKNA